MAKWDIIRVGSSPTQATAVKRLLKKGWEHYTTTPSGEVNLKRRSGYVEPKPKRRKKNVDLPVEVEVEPESNHSLDT